MKHVLACTLALAALAAPVLAQQVAPQQAAPSANAPQQLPPAPGAIPVPGASPTAKPVNNFGAVITRVSGQPLEGVSVSVNNDVISFSDVRNRMALILMGTGVQPNEEILAQTEARAVDALINEKIYVQEYTKLIKDRKVEDVDIDNRIEGIAKQNNMTTEAFLGDMQSRGINVSTLRERLRAEIGWQRLIGARFGRNIRISPLQIDDRLAQIKANADKPSYRMMEIFLLAPDAASKAKANKLAVELKAQIEKGAHFDVVAQQYSYAPSASTGGDLDWVSQGDLKPAVAKVIDTLKPPAFLEPFETEEGVYLMAYVGKRDAADPNDAKLNLKQMVARGDDAEAKLIQAKATVKSCADVEKSAAAVDGVRATSLNDIALSGLADTIRPSVAPLQPGQATGVLDLPSSKTVLFVCERDTGGNLPKRKNIEDMIYEQQIGMLADRYLRDLKRDATIIRPDRRGP